MHRQRLQRGRRDVHHHPPAADQRSAVTDRQGGLVFAVRLPPVSDAVGRRLAEAFPAHGEGCGAIVEDGDGHRQGGHTDLEGFGAGVSGGAPSGGGFGLGLSRGCGDGGTVRYGWHGRWRFAR